MTNNEIFRRRGSHISQILNGPFNPNTDTDHRYSDLKSTSAIIAQKLSP